MSKVDATINIKVTNLGELTKLEKRIKKIQGNVNVGQSPEIKALQLENKELKEKIELLKQEGRLQDQNLKKRRREDAGRTRRGRRIQQSALIGGGFPLLFGGGPLQALAGGLGGGFGEAISPGGGFAGSIAATAALSSIQKATDNIAKLGQAMNPLTMDLQRLTQSMGMVGTPAEKYLKVLYKFQEERIQVLAEEVGNNATNLPCPDKNENIQVKTEELVLYKRSFQPDLVHLILLHVHIKIMESLS